ncbi:hypothetical protein [Mesorhizobium sp.]|uniref:hypothetical protein n=1 Tax=Mesorhizobium sp. TaxID=1871066 RepID=UPI000FE9312D|nr:hypothetical protein [Mesorhizobium sp.]RWM09456.1 MAG: hypothetical protein EOR71_09695 [Mesorhizobium sp.]
MSTSRRALLSILGASIVHAAFIGIAYPKGGGGGKGGGKGAGRDGAMDTGTGLVPSSVSETNSKQVRTFKLFEGKGCRRDYARLCPTRPMGKCDLEGNIEQLSPACKAFVEKHR